MTDVGLNKVTGVKQPERNLRHSIPLLAMAGLLLFALPLTKSFRCSFCTHVTEEEPSVQES